MRAKSSSNLIVPVQCNALAKKDYSQKKVESDRMYFLALLIVLYIYVFAKITDFSSTFQCIYVEGRLTVNLQIKLEQTVRYAPRAKKGLLLPAAEFAVRTEARGFANRRQALQSHKGNKSLFTHDTNRAFGLKRPDLGFFSCL